MSPDAGARDQKDSNQGEHDVTCENVLCPEILGIWPSEPRQHILDQLGVWVLEGCTGVDTDLGARAVQGYIVSARHMRLHDVAWRIDKSGGNWVQWLTSPILDDLPPESCVVFVFGMAMGIGNPMPQESGTFRLYVNDKPLVTFRMVKHTEVWHSSDASFCYQVKKVLAAPPYHGLSIDPATLQESTASYGLGLLRLPVNSLPPGGPVRLRVEAGTGLTERPTTHWFRLDVGSSQRSPGEGYGTLTELNYWQGLLRVTGKAERPRVGPYSVYFGDIHTHSGTSHDPQRRGCGTGTPEENHAFARDVANLDFYALTDHEWQMPEGRGWDLRQEMAERYNEDGRFVTLLGYEWGLGYGQRCVYYELGGQPLYSYFEKAPTPTVLWELLEKTSGRAITIPHHPSWSKVPLDLNYCDPRFDRLFEVYSIWGNFEYDGAVLPGAGDRFQGHCLRDVLRLGYRMGVIASSDGHDAHPGDAQGLLSRNPHKLHYLGSGRAVVLAEELTRQAVFDALYDRRTYGTTGEPIVLDFRVNGLLMGGEIPADSLCEPPDIEVEATGTVPLTRIVLIRNGEIAHVQPCDARRGHLSWRDQDYETAAYYYVRVEQRDGEMAWSSPIWII